MVVASQPSPRRQPHPSSQAQPPRRIQLVAGSSAQHAASDDADQRYSATNAAATSQINQGQCMVTRYAFRGGSHWRQSRKSTKLVFDFRLSRRFVDSLSRSTLSPKFNMFNSVDLSKVGNFCRRNIARMSNVLSILWPMCTGPNRHGRLSCRI